MINVMKRTLLFLALAALAARAIAAGVKIDVTHKPDECEQKAESGSFVHVHYVGKLAADGSEFDNSLSRGEPIAFPLGAGRVIPGWEQGILGMCVGEKRTLTIPPELGYGEDGIGPIPGGATLVFDVELVKVSEGGGDAGGYGGGYGEEYGGEEEDGDDEYAEGDEQAEWE